MTTAPIRSRGLQRLRVVRFLRRERFPAGRQAACSCTWNSLPRGRLSGLANRSAWPFEPDLEGRFRQDTARQASFRRQARAPDGAVLAIDSMRSSAREGLDQLNILGILQEGNTAEHQPQVPQSMHDARRCGPSQVFHRSPARNIRARASRRSLFAVGERREKQLIRVSSLFCLGMTDMNAAPYRASTQTAIRGYASPQAAWRGAGMTL